eukprot:scaffold12033_cov125-Isochrysis_galbana.AAC.3
MAASELEKLRISPKSPKVRGGRCLCATSACWTVVVVLRPSVAEVMPSATPTTGLTIRPTAPWATPLKKPSRPPFCAP